MPGKAGRCGLEADAISAMCKQDVEAA